MNAWQQIQQLAYLIRSATWADGSTEKVVSDAIETGMDVRDIVGTGPRLPFVTIAPGPSEADPESPDVVLQTYEMTLVCRVAGGKYGRPGVVGGARLGGDQGKSSGRGILELEEEVLGAVHRLTGADGLRATCAYKGAVGVGRVASSDSYTFRDYTLVCAATRARYYHPVAQATATQSGADVVLTWKNPGTRWDTYKIVARRASGPTAPASPTDGEDVAITGTPETVTDTAPGSGTHSYALFVAYDEKWKWKAPGASPAEAERHSAQETGTSVTITVS